MSRHYKQHSTDIDISDDDDDALNFSRPTTRRRSSSVSLRLDNQRASIPTRPRGKSDSAHGKNVNPGMSYSSGDFAGTESSELPLPTTYRQTTSSVRDDSPLLPQEHVLVAPMTMLGDSFPSVVESAPDTQASTSQYDDIGQLTDSARSSTVTSLMAEDFEIESVDLDDEAPELVCRQTDSKRVDFADVELPPEQSNAADITHDQTPSPQSGNERNTTTSEYQEDERSLSEPVLFTASTSSVADNSVVQQLAIEAATSPPSIGQSTQSQGIVALGQEEAALLEAPLIASDPDASESLAIAGPVHEGTSEAEEEETLTEAPNTLHDVSGAHNKVETEVEKGTVDEFKGLNTLSSADIGLSGRIEEEVTQESDRDQEIDTQTHIDVNGESGMLEVQPADEFSEGRGDVEDPGAIEMRGNAEPPTGTTDQHDNMSSLETTVDLGVNTSQGRADEARIGATEDPAIEALTEPSRGGVDQGSSDAHPSTTSSDMTTSHGIVGHAENFIQTVGNEDTEESGMVESDTGLIVNAVISSIGTEFVNEQQEANVEPHVETSADENFTPLELSTHIELNQEATNAQHQETDETEHSGETDRPVMDDVVLDVAASGQLTSRVEDTFAFDSPHQEAQVVDADMNGDVRSDRATEEIAILDSALRNDDDDAPPICDAPSPLRPITSSQEDISPTETAPTVACTYQPSLLKPGTSLRVVTPYVASEDEELALEMDDVIDLDAAPATDDEYWWYGINRSWGPRNGEKGYFPAHCVRVENWEVALSMPTDVNPVTAATEEEPIELGLAEDADIPETNSSPEDDTRNTAEELLAPDIDDENPEMAIPAPVPPGTKVIVTHPYTRLKADELDLRMGEVVVVMESPDGGWWRGMKNLDGKEPQSGWFPATMVQVEPQERRISIDSTTRSRVALSVPTALPSNNPQAKRQSWYKRLVKKDKIPQGKGSRHRSNSAPSNSNVNLAAWGADRTSIFGSPHRSADILGLEAVLEGCSESELQRSREDNSGGQANSSVEWRQQRSQSAPPATDDMQSTMALDSNVEASAFSLAPSPNDYLVSKFSTGNRQSFIATDDAQAMSIQWQEWVPREILQKMGPKERKRMTAIFELIATERDYVRDLKIIINLFKKPMLDKKVLNNKTADALFSNIEELLSVNQDFLLSLERLYSENPVIEKIGHVLLTSMNQFISYSLYCSQNSTSANKQLNGLHSKREARVFLEEAYKNPATRHLDLGGFLIKPVQRICKYPLLIREILHYTDQRSPDYLLLKSAYDRIQGIVAIANEGARKADMLRRVADIQGNFADKVNIVTSNRHLVREDNIFISYAETKKPRRLLFFNDLLMLARKDWRDKYHLVDQGALAECVVSDVLAELKDPESALVELEILPTASHPVANCYLFSFPSNQAKQAWLETYRSVVPPGTTVKSKHLNEAGTLRSNPDLFEDDDEPAAQTIVQDEEARLQLAQERGKVQGLSSTLAALEQKLADLGAKHAEVTAQLETALASRETLEKEKDQVLEQLQTQRATLAAGGRRLADLERENREIRDEMNRKVNDIRAEIATLNTTIESLRRQLAEAEASAAAIVEQKNAELLDAQLKHQLALDAERAERLAESVRLTEKYSAEISQLGIIMSRAKEEAEAHLCRVQEAADSKIATMTHDKEAQVKDLYEQLAQEKNNSRRAVQELEEAHANELSRVHNEMEMSRQRADEVNRDLRRALSDSSDRLAERDETIQRLESAARNLTLEVAKFELERTQQSAEISRLNAALESKKDEHRLIVANLERVLNERHATLDRKETEIGDLIRKLAENQASQSELERSYNRLKEEIAEQKAERVKEQHELQVSERNYRETTKQLEVARARETQLTEVGRRLGEEHARLKHSLGTQLTQAHQEKQTVQAQLIEAQEKLAKLSQELEASKAEERATKSRLQEDTHRAIIRAERAEAQVADSERNRASLDRQHQASLSEVSNLKLRLNQSEEEARKQLDACRRQFAAELQERREKLLAENEELRARVQHQAVKERDSEDLKRKLESVEHALRNSEAAKAKLETDLSSVRQSFADLDAQYKEKTRSASALKKRVRLLESEHEKLASAWHELQFRYQQLEHLQRETQEDASQLRARLSVADQDASAVHRHSQAYAELELKYQEVRDEAARLTQSMRSNELELRKVQAMLARRNREATGLHMVMSEIAKAVSLPLINLGQVAGPSTVSTSQVILHGSNEAITSPPLEIVPSTIDESRMMVIITRVHEMSAENERLREEIEMEHNKQQGMVEIQSLLEEERNAAQVTVQRLEAKLKDRASRHRIGSEETARQLRDMKHEKETVEKALQEATARATSLETEKRQLERQLGTVSERLQSYQDTHGKDATRVFSENAALKKEVEMLSKVHHEAAAKVEVLMDKLKGSEMERSHLLHLTASLKEYKNSTQAVLDSTQESKRRLESDLDRWKHEVDNLRMELQRREEKVRTQKAALIKGSADIAAITGDCEEKLREFANFKLKYDQLEQHQSMLSHELSESRQREGELRQRLNTLSGELQWHRMSAEPAAARGSTLSAGKFPRDKHPPWSRPPSRLAQSTLALDRDDLGSGSRLQRPSSAPGAPRRRHDMIGMDMLHAAEAAEFVRSKQQQLTSILAACQRLLATAHDQQMRGSRNSSTVGVATSCDLLPSSRSSDRGSTSALQYLVDTARHDVSTNAIREADLCVQSAKTTTQELVDGVFRHLGAQARVDRADSGSVNERRFKASTPLAQTPASRANAADDGDVAELFDALEGLASYEPETERRLEMVERIHTARELILGEHNHERVERVSSQSLADRIDERRFAPLRGGEEASSPPPNSERRKVGRKQASVVSVPPAPARGRRFSMPTL